MKKHFYLFSIVMLASSLFMAAPAKAESSNANNNSNQGGIISDILNDLGLGGSSSAGSGSGSGSNCALPINDDIVYLLMGGAIIGVTTLNRKTLALKA